MLTKLTIKNFKLFEEVQIELGDAVVFVGPNNSGKTSALQALALWEVGLRRWNEKRAGKTAPEKRPGVTINRRDLVSVPIPSADLMWRNLHTRDVSRQGGKQRTENLRVDIVVEGVTAGAPWTCGFEFDYANPESFYCRPLRLDPAATERMPVPPEASTIRLAFLPPMSGLSAQEFIKQQGEIAFLIGQGRTAEVLRNICHLLLQQENGDDQWQKVVDQIEALFGVRVDAPEYMEERSELVMGYRERSGIRLDLSSSGKGLQQTLLLLAYLAVNQGSVLLLDEPDAHLEILRQRQIYQALVETAREHDSQVIAASHSEVVLNEAAGRDMVVAFVGRPHRIDDRGSQVLKALKDIGFDHYYQAEQTGWVLYLEGSTDLAILQKLAEKLAHPAQEALDRPFVHYINNNLSAAREHFHGLREAAPQLSGYALIDRTDCELRSAAGLTERMWTKRELENYICSQEVLLEWARITGAEKEGGPLLAEHWVNTMDECIEELESALSTMNKPSPWSSEIKASDDFLDPLFANFFKKLELPNLLRKSGYYQLAALVRPEDIDPEVREVLDGIWQIFQAAQTRPEREGDAE